MSSEGCFTNGAFNARCKTGIGTGSLFCGNCLLGVRNNVKFSCYEMIATRAIASFLTLCGASGSGCLNIIFHVVTESSFAFFYAIVTASTGVGGISCLGAGSGSNYNIGIAVFMIQRRNDSGFFSITNGAYSVFCAVFIFGGFFIGDPLTPGVVESGKGNGFSGKLFAAYRAVNYVVVVSGFGTSSINFIFYNNFASYAGSDVFFTTPVAVVIIVVVITFGKGSTTPITLVIVRDVLTLGGLGAPNVTLVVLYFLVDTAGTLNVTNVTDVIVVVILTLAHGDVANITFVVAIVVSAGGESFAANIAEVIDISIVASGEDITTNVTLVIFVGVSAFG